MTKDEIEVISVREYARRRNIEEREAKKASGQTTWAKFRRWASDRSSEGKNRET